MAGFTLGPKVSAEERIFGMKLMVKDDRFPISLCVAGCALLSVGAFMLVVFLVT